MQPPQNPEHKNANTKCPACHTDGTCSGYDHQTIPCRCRCAVPANDMDLQASVTPKLQSGIHPEHKHTECCEKCREQCIPQIDGTRYICINHNCECHTPPQRVDCLKRFDKQFVGNDTLDYLRPCSPQEIRNFITKELADARREERRMVIGGLVTLVESLIGAKADELNTKDTLLLCVVLVNIKEDLKRTLLNNLKEDV